MRCILAIDQGTTGSTVLVVDMTEPSESVVLGRATVDFTQHYPHTGWVEHDLEEIWGSVVQASKKALEQAAANRPGFSPNSLIALGITNQRETLCVFERGTGKPLARAIVWQCKRSAAIVERLKAQGVEATVRRKTGLLLDPYFSGTKITWLMEHDAALAAKRLSPRRAMPAERCALISTRGCGMTSCWRCSRCRDGMSCQR